MDRPGVAPLPPVADVELPWDALVADPVAELGGARSRHGDTFVVDSGRDRYLFLFSPEGVRSFYALTEEMASKGIADWRMLRRKLPDALFTGRRTLPHELFGRHDTAAYLDHLDAALDAAVAELGDSGELEALAFARRLAHRMGLASWAGPGSASGDRFEHLVEALDASTRPRPSSVPTAWPRWRPRQGRRAGGPDPGCRAHRRLAGRARCRDRPLPGSGGSGSVQPHRRPVGRRGA